MLKNNKNLRWFVGLFFATLLATLLFTGSKVFAVTCPGGNTDSSGAYWGRNIGCTYYINIDGNNVNLSAKSYLPWPAGYENSGTNSTPLSNNTGALEFWVSNMLNSCGNPFDPANCPGATLDAQHQADASATAASFMINTMLGLKAGDPAFTVSGNTAQTLINGVRYSQNGTNFSKWKNLIQTYSDNNLIDWDVILTCAQIANIPTSDCGGAGAHSDSHERYMDLYGADQIITQSTDSTLYHYIGFKSPTGGYVYLINRLCGNVSGTTGGLPTLNAFNITGDGNIAINTEDTSASPVTFTFWQDVSIPYGPVKIIKNEDICWTYYYKHNGVQTFLLPSPAPGTIPLFCQNDPFYHAGHTVDLNVGNNQDQIQATFTLPRLSSGDIVCFYEQPATSYGFLDSQGNIQDQGSGVISFGRCATVANQPYLSVFGGDVFAGGGIDDGSGTCTSNNSAKIKTFSTATNPYEGSGSQFAAYATGQIQNDNSSYGFDTARLGIGSPDPPLTNATAVTNLTFANTNPILGQMGNTNCLSYPFNPSGTSSIPPQYVSSGVLDLNGLSSSPNNNGNYYYNGNLTTNSISNLADGSKLVVYVNGNLYIQSNSTFANENGWSSANAIPSLFFIVKGDIYIDHNVTNIVGNYIAEKNTNACGSEQSHDCGVIFTCTNTSGNAEVNYVINSDIQNQIATTCASQLTVKGTLLAADNIKWQRTFGTSHFATSSENPYNGTNANCGLSTCAAEVIIDGPENYLSIPINSTLGNVQSITDLPPVL